MKFEINVDDLKTANFRIGQRVKVWEFGDCEHALVGLLAGIKIKDDPIMDKTAVMNVEPYSGFTSMVEYLSKANNVLIACAEKITGKPVDERNIQ